MAEPLQVFDALKERVASLDNGDELKISVLDDLDLQRLTNDDLAARGCSADQAQAVVHDLLRGSLQQLGSWLGVRLASDQVLSLVPQERIRESAGMLAHEGQTHQEMLEELDRIRHPERYAK